MVTDWTVSMICANNGILTWQKVFLIEITSEALYWLVLQYMYMEIKGFQSITMHIIAIVSSD